MTMTAEQREQVATELKRFAVDLDLSEEQKEKLQTALADGRERVGEYLKSHPNTTNRLGRQKKLAATFLCGLKLSTGLEKRGVALTRKTTPSLRVTSMR